MSPRKRAILYLRVSTLRQVQEGQSLDQQDETLRRRAMQMGFEIIDVFSDEGISAHNRDRSRQGLEEAIEFAESHLERGDAFFIHNVSRFSRRHSQGSPLRDRLERAGILLVDSNMDYPYTPMGNMYWNTMLSQAQWFSDNQVQEVHNSMQRLRSHGRWQAKAPFGYRVGGGHHKPSMVVCHEEAEVIREVFRKIATGVSQTEVALWLNSNGIVRQRMKGKTLEVQRKRVHRWLRMHAYRGVIQTKADESPIQGDFEAIVSQELFDAARQVVGLTPRPTRAYSTRLDEFPLKRVLFCGVCQSGFTGYYASQKAKGKKYPLYRCMGCKESIKLGDAHSQAMDNLSLIGVQEGDMRLLVESVASLANEQLANIADQRRGLESELTKVVEKAKKYLDAFIEERITSEDYQPMAEELREQKVLIGKQLTSLPTITSDLVALAVEELSRLLNDPKSCWESTPTALWHELAKVYFPNGLVCEGKKIRTDNFLGFTRANDPFESQTGQLVLLVAPTSNFVLGLVERVAKSRLEFVA